MEMLEKSRNCDLKIRKQSDVLYLMYTHDIDFNSLRKIRLYLDSDLVESCPLLLSEEERVFLNSCKEGSVKCSKILIDKILSKSKPLSSHQILSQVDPFFLGPEQAMEKRKFLNFHEEYMKILKDRTTAESWQKLQDFITGFKYRALYLASVANPDRNYLLEHKSFSRNDYIRAIEFNRLSYMDKNLSKVLGNSFHVKLSESY